MIEPLPKDSTTREVLKTTITATVAGVPYVGGSIATVMLPLLSSALNKRRELWFNDLANYVDMLLRQSLDSPSLEDFIDNPLFLDAITRSIKIAESTSDSIKLEALTSAVLNSTSELSPGLDEQTMFLNYIQDLTGSHIQILNHLNNPKKDYEIKGIKWPDNISMGSKGFILQTAFPNLTQAFYDPLLKELEIRSLILGSSLGVTQNGYGLASSFTTPRGKAFLSFIINPVIKTE